MRYFTKMILLLVFVTLLPSCTTLDKPEGIEPIQDFELSRYLGTWYEIVRLDHRFERGLSKVTATYSMREDGGITVVNKGFHSEDGQWDEATGKAYFVDGETTGHLKVSFFGPFYASYVIAELDKQNYQWALITGPSRDYFWILSRTKKMPQETLERLLDKAENLGFTRRDFIFVAHD